MDPKRLELTPEPESVDRDSQIEALLVAGLDHYFARRHDEAIHVWTRVLFLDRTHARARAYIERARTALAERQRRAEELLATGHSLIDQGRTEAARDVLAEAVATTGDDDARSLLTVASRALREDMATRVQRFVDEPDQAFALGQDGTIAWRGVPVGRLAAGRHALSPTVDIPRNDLLEPAQRDEVRRRLGSWVIAEIRRRLAPLVLAQDAPLSGPARGLVYQLGEALGSLSRRQVAPLIAAHLELVAASETQDSNGEASWHASVK